MEDEEEISDPDTENNQRVRASRVLGGPKAPLSSAAGGAAKGKSAPAMAGPRKSSWWDSWEKKKAAAAAADAAAGGGPSSGVASASADARVKHVNGQGKASNSSQHSSAVPFDRFAFTGASRPSGFKTLQKKAGESTQGSDKNQGTAPIQWPSRSSNGPQGLNPRDGEGASAATAVPHAANGSAPFSSQFKPKAFQPPKVLSKHADSGPRDPVAELRRVRESPAGKGAERPLVGVEGLGLKRPAPAPGATKVAAPACSGAQVPRASASKYFKSQSPPKPEKTAGSTKADQSGEQLTRPEGGAGMIKQQVEPVKKFKRSKVLDDDSSDDAADPTAHIKMREATRLKVLDIKIGAGPKSGPSQPSAWKPQPSKQLLAKPQEKTQAAIPAKTQGKDKDRVKSFFVPVKRQRRLSARELVSDDEEEEEEAEAADTPPEEAGDVDTLTTTLEDDDSVEVWGTESPAGKARASPVMSRLRKRKAVDKSVITIDDSVSEPDGKAGGTQSGAEEDDGDGDATETLTGSEFVARGSAEGEDPVAAAMRKCEAIAAGLQRKVAESRAGASAGEDGSRGDSDKERDNKSGRCFSQVEASGPLLVSPADVAAACGRAIELKPYQLVGVNFLLLLKRQGVGGAILADEMGLGKTVQAICFLALLGHLENDPGPHLVVAPASLLENWQRELKQWCPGLRVVLFHGSDRADTREEIGAVLDRRKQRKRWLLGERKGGDGGEEEEEDEGEGLGSQGCALPFDVMLTCYSLFERDSQMQKDDRKFLRRIEFSCVLMDEAHLLKAATSQRTAHLRKVTSRAKHRLMLTGTPLQNDLQELWCLLELLHPAIFGPSSSGKEQDVGEYLRSHGSKGEVIERMKTMLAPFVLRRVKADVMRQLSAKVQRVEAVDMVPGQAALYRQSLDTCWKALRESSEGGSKAGGRKKKPMKDEGENINSEVEALGNGGPPPGAKDVASSLPRKQIASLFTHLRKVANHPLLVRSAFSDAAVDELAPLLHRAGAFGHECKVERVLEELRNCSDFEINRLCAFNLDAARPAHAAALRKYSLTRDHFLRSGKCQELQRLLPGLRAQGHRVLIFSQWTAVLDLLEHVLAFLDLNFLRLDGSTQVVERQQLVDEFNNDPSIFAFLLSTRAGGQGLNLTGADTVILHDVDFNPQMDKQAEDRAHRIGQTKPVTIIRLVCKDTVDEKILQIANRKLSLDAALLSSAAKPVAVAEEASNNMADILNSLFAEVA